MSLKEKLSRKMSHHYFVSTSWRIIEEVKNEKKLPERIREK